MSKAPAMPMYWDAYLADTTHLTTEEHGAYMLLLAAMWRRDGAVPDDDKDNARILGLTLAKWRKTKRRFVDTISGFCIEEGRVTQEKLKKTWETTQEKIEKNRRNGSKGGRASYLKNNDLNEAGATNSLKPKPNKPDPKPDPPKEPAGSLEGQFASPAQRRLKKKCPAMPIPQNWVPSEINIGDAKDRHFSIEEIAHEADQFRNHHLAQGSHYENWDAAWRKWLGNARKFSSCGRMVGKTSGAGYGRGSSIASVIARGRAGS